MALINDLYALLETKNKSLADAETSLFGWQNALSQQNADLTWLINSNKKGKNDGAIFNMQKEIGKSNERITYYTNLINSLKTEISGITSQIQELNTATSNAVASGIPESVAIQLGEQALKDKQRKQAEEQAKIESDKKKKKLFIIIGGVVFVMIVIGAIIYFRRKK